MPGAPRSDLVRRRRLIVLEITPITLKEAHAFVRRHHRHHKPTQGALFAIAASREGEVVGVAVVAFPVARMLRDGWTAELHNESIPRAGETG